MDQGEKMAAHLLSKAYRLADRYKEKYGWKLYKERSGNTIFKCDSCDRETVEYLPPGWEDMEFRCVSSCSGTMKLFR